jgi:hypothetical protein
MMGAARASKRRAREMGIASHSNNFCTSQPIFTADLFRRIVHPICWGG